MIIKSIENNSQVIRVMWLSINPSLFDVEKTSGGWTSSLEAALKEYCRDEIELAVVFEGDKTIHRRRKPEKIVIDDTPYYMISDRRLTPSKALKRPDSYDMWDYIRPEILVAIEDFKPDIIQCFGSEWPFGMIAKDVDVPVVIHMQGFVNAYDLSLQLLPHKDTLRSLLVGKVPKRKKSIIRYDGHEAEVEKEVMKINHHFMGRTQWDKRMVKYYSKAANYYHIPEVMRPSFYEEAGTWQGGTRGGKAKLLTVSQASPLKGNEIILYTAKILKELIGIDFEWNVAGNPDMIKAAEKATGIRSKDVNVNLVGWISQDRIIKELQNSNAFVHPSIIDNSPNAICEAQLIGCPVIASNVGGVPDLIEDGRTGFLYPYNEPHTLAFRIAELMEQPLKLEEISKNETMTAMKRNDPQTIADEVYRIYKEIAGGALKWE